MKKLLILAFLAILPAAALAETGVRIVVPAREIARGEIIAESDLAYSMVPATDVLSGTVMRMDALIGMQTRRILHSGMSVRDDDVRHPIIVTKGQTVTMSFTAPGIVLTAQGRAMSEGGLGDTVTVQNPVSFRMVSAVVSGAGAVVAAGTDAGLGAAVNVPSRIAANR